MGLNTLTHHDITNYKSCFLVDFNGVCRIYIQNVGVLDNSSFTYVHRQMIGGPSVLVRVPVVSSTAPVDTPASAPGSSVTDQHGIREKDSQPGMSSM